MKRLFAFLAVILVIFPTAADETGPLTHSRYTKGQFLVASPKMGDPRFRETVIYMVRHDATGAFGLIINKTLGKGPLAAFLEGAGLDPGEADGTIPLFYGGPVKPEMGFVLHSPDFQGATTQSLIPGLAMTAGREVLQAMAKDRGPKQTMIVLGYSGWGPDQLEGEMARGDWITAPATAGLVFDDDTATKWQRARETGGISL